MTRQEAVFNVNSLSPEGFDGLRILDYTLYGDHGDGIKNEVYITEPSGAVKWPSSEEACRYHAVLFCYLLSTYRGEGLDSYCNVPFDHTLILPDGNRVRYKVNLRILASAIREASKKSNRRMSFRAYNKAIRDLLNYFAVHLKLTPVYSVKIQRNYSVVLTDVELILCNTFNTGSGLVAEVAPRLSDLLKQDREETLNGTRKFKKATESDSSQEPKVISLKVNLPPIK